MVTRAEIVAITGLTHPTVTNIVDRLLRKGMVERAGNRQGARGQPAMQLTLNSSYACSIGICINRSGLTMVAIDFSRKVRARIRDTTTFPTPVDVAAFCSNQLERLISNIGFSSEQVMGIGIALPNGICKADLPSRLSGYKGWTETDVSLLLNDMHALPVWVENNAVAAAMSEIYFGIGQRYSKFLYILITYDLDHCLIVNGGYNRDPTGRPGGIGLIEVNDGTGRQVPLHDVVSLAGLARSFKNAGLEWIGVGSPDLTNSAIAQEVRDWVKRSARALVQPLLAVNYLIGPEAVVIGGRLPVAVADQLAQETSELLRVHGLNLPVHVTVQTAGQVEDAFAVGAALLPFQDSPLPSQTHAPHFDSRKPSPI